MNRTASVVTIFTVWMSRTIIKDCKKRRESTKQVVGKESRRYDHRVL